MNRVSPQSPPSISSVSPWPSGIGHWCRLVLVLRAGVDRRSAVDPRSSVARSDLLRIAWLFNKNRGVNGKMGRLTSSTNKDTSVLTNKIGSRRNDDQQ